MTPVTSVTRETSAGSSGARPGSSALSGRGAEALALPAVSSPPAADYPTQGLVLRGRTGNSVVLWLVGLLAGLVVASDVVVVVEWLLRGQPRSLLFVLAGIVLAASTVLLVVTTALTALGVRGQRYRVSAQGIDLPWRSRRPDLHLPWYEIQAIARRYDSAPGGRVMGVAVFVVRPDRFLTGDRPAGTRSRLADEHMQRYGSPIFLDLTDVPGGTVRFFNAVRHYAAGVGHPDLVLS